MQLNPFMPIGSPFALTTNSSGSTSQSAKITFASLGITGGKPATGRFLNKGTADIWVVVTSEATTAVLPVAGTTTGGTVGNVGGVWLEPGVDLIFTLVASVGRVDSATLYINTISTGTSQSLYCQFGEGA
jgi:hypothetical protein